MIKQYRKKPVVIQAMLWDGDESTAEELKKWIGAGMMLDLDDPTFSIPTLEGNMNASRGDYVIKGVAGEFYPCKPDIFASTYEEVTPDMRAGSDTA
ncbi:MAG TPA: hypothetical protein VH234_06150 [Candidatus Saccharimonadales bacterium]|jgi:hypothetical protein|nr:hypothetical protein [Candidatus Saccharimonadales bacterium]